MTSLYSRQWCLESNHHLITVLQKITFRDFKSRIMEIGSFNTLLQHWHWNENVVTHIHTHIQENNNLEIIMIYSLICCSICTSGYTNLCSNWLIEMTPHVSVIDEEEKNVLTGSRYLTSTWNRTSKLDRTLNSPRPQKRKKKEKTGTMWVDNHRTNVVTLTCPMSPPCLWMCSTEWKLGRLLKEKKLSLCEKRRVKKKWGGEREEGAMCCGWKWSAEVPAFRTGATWETPCGGGRARWSHLSPGSVWNRSAALTSHQSGAPTRLSAERLRPRAAAPTPTRMSALPLEQ